jgi:hypothetical protein
MSDDEPKKYGRTWADVFAQTSYLIAGIIFLVIVGVIVWFIFDRLPQWFFLSVIGSLIFIPFLIERAKEKADLMCVMDEPMKFTEYRVGRKYSYDLYGNPVFLSSRTGVIRMMLLDFNKTTNTAKALPFAELTPLDQMRELKTNIDLSNMFQEHLKEVRISKQMIGIEVEKESTKIVDWALKVLYGSIIPTELEEIYEPKHEAEDPKESETILFEDIVGDTETV